MIISRSFAEKQVGEWLLLKMYCDAEGRFYFCSKHNYRRLNEFFTQCLYVTFSLAFIVELYTIYFISSPLFINYTSNVYELAYKLSAVIEIEKKLSKTT